MFPFDAPLFWYKLLFMFELLVAEGLATYTLKKRSRFAWRVVACVAGCEAVAFLFPLGSFSYNALYSSFMFLALFGCTLAALKFCYNEPWVNVLFCGILAYTTQHIAFETYNYVSSAAGFQGFGNMYAPDGYTSFNPISIGVWIGAYGVLYWFAWAFVDRRIRLQDDLQIGNLPLLALSGAIVLIDVVLNAVVTYGSDALSLTLRTVIFIYNVLSCGLAVGIQFSMLGKRIAETELAAVQQLWDQDKKLYELSKTNIEVINVKCHDLRKQLRALRSGSGEVDKAALAEIEHAVNIYDGAVKTGCDVLDIILAEKSLYCERNGIVLTVIADGSKLQFMGQFDVYSLFENAISNAIEAVNKEEDREKRFIRLRVDAPAGMVCIHAENYCPVPPVFVNGLPKTTKKDINYHGFGVRSMQMIAEKYGGGLSAHVERDIFNLDIAIPLPAAVGEK